MSNFHLHIDEKKNDADVRFVLDQHTTSLDLYSASSLKQQYTGRHVAPLKTNYPDFEPNQSLLILFYSCVYSNKLIVW